MHRKMQSYPQQQILMRILSSDDSAASDVPVDETPLSDSDKLEATDQSAIEVDPVAEIKILSG